mmetsp:Transcript_21604/g.56334  ORF Transcript_21604/g.56334 Transcript_21604/m.56334 type:complete len:149 (-) Transcript_21604:4916-5362(-)
MKGQLLKTSALWIGCWSCGPKTNESIRILSQLYTELTTVLVGTLNVSVVISMRAKHAPTVMLVVIHTGKGQLSCGLVDGHEAEVEAEATEVVAGDAVNVVPRKILLQRLTQAVSEGLGVQIFWTAIAPRLLNVPMASATSLVFLNRSY